MTCRLVKLKGFAGLVKLAAFPGLPNLARVAPFIPWLPMERNDNATHFYYLWVSFNLSIKLGARG